MRCGTPSTRMAPFLLFAFARPSSVNSVVNVDVCLCAHTHTLVFLSL